MLGRLAPVCASEVAAMPATDPRKCRRSEVMGTILVAPVFSLLPGRGARSLNDPPQIIRTEEFSYRNRAGVRTEKPVHLVLVLSKGAKERQHLGWERLHTGALARAFVHRHDRRVPPPLIFRE